MTKLTTHVLDIYSGKPGKGIKVDLYYFEGTEKQKLNSITLNNDGRTDKPLVEGTNFKEGKEILDKSGLKILSASDLNEAAKKIVDQIK